jgi:hypothetical protein
LFISSAFLLNKEDPYLNNDFVKSHTKVAWLIHLGFALTIIIFLFIWTGINISFLWYSIDQIIAITIFFILSFLLVLWITKAHNGKKFKLGDSIELYKNQWLLNTNWDWQITEQEKLEIILSKIPFIGHFIYAKKSNNQLIENNTKLNLIITTILLLLYIYWNTSLANLLLLVYIIFVVFTAINLFTQDKIINLNLEKVPFPNIIVNYLKALKIYLWNYFSSKKDFSNYNNILSQIIEKNKQKKLQFNEEIKNKDNFKLPKIIIYIPILNFISLFNFNTKEKRHIINWILLSILFIILWLIKWFYNSYQLILLLPLSFWLAFLLAWKYDYKIPFLYDFYELFTFTKSKTKEAVETLKEKQKEEKVLNLKVED